MIVIMYVEIYKSCALLSFLGRHEISYGEKNRSLCKFEEEENKCSATYIVQISIVQKPD